MNRHLPPLLAAALITVSPGLAAHDDFAATFAAKAKADINFAQLMQIMQRATSMILDGILAENKEMTVLGAHLLDAHPAPAQGPGAAMVPEQREAFKNVMPAYDKVFHSATERLSVAASQGQWPPAWPVTKPGARTRFPASRLPASASHPPPAVNRPGPRTARRR